jgi:catechol 2,3-dioxygenase-like lactoylglutathione lyase family enzyme
MTLGWKLVVDCSDAPRLAEFWAAALGYEAEDPGPLIEQLLGAGHLDERAVTERAGKKTFRGMAAVRHPDEPFDPVSGVGKGRRILFQEVPEPKAGKNRLHIDVHHDDSLEALVDRLEQLGATKVQDVNQGPAGHWWVMRDPEGNEFCAA